MKIRNGFVSNSSSSSFIISSEMHIEPKVCIEIPMSQLNAKCITNIDDLNKYFIKNYGIIISKDETFEEALEINEVEQIYKNCSDKINNNKALWMFEASSDSDDGDTILYGKKLPYSKDYEIVYEEC